MTRRSFVVVSLLVAAAGAAVTAGQAPAQSSADLIPYQKNATSESKLWGYADASGRLIIPAQFDVAKRFSDGLAEIKRGGRWGMINRDGREVIPARNSYQVPAVDGRAGACVDNGQPIPGMSILGPRPGQRTAVSGTICGYLDRDGAVAIPFEYSWLHPFRDGVAPVSISKQSDVCPAVDFGRAMMYGAIDTSGRLVVPVEVCHIGPVEDGWMRVVYDSPSLSVQHVGFVDRAGKVVLPKLTYDFAGEHWWENLLPVRTGNRWGFIDRKGREVVPVRYQDVASVSEGRARVRLNDKWGFVDTSGKVVVPPIYDDAGDFSDGLACVKIGEHTGFIDQAGKVVIEPRFDWNWSCSRAFTEGLRATPQGGKWGFIDRTGRFVIPPTFDDAWGFSEGLAAFRQGTSWGFLDRGGKVAVPSRYFRIDDGFIDGYARVVVRINNPCCPGLFKFSEGFINHEGREFFDAP